MFAGYVPLASRSPYPITVYFLANYRPHLSHFLENVIQFRDPNLVTFYLCIYLINPLKRSSKNELTQFFKVNKEHFTVYFIVKFNIEQHSDFLLTRDRPILNPYLITPKIRKFATPF